MAQADPVTEPLPDGPMRDLRVAESIRPHVGPTGHLVPGQEIQRRARVAQLAARYDRGDEEITQASERGTFYLEPPLFHGPEEIEDDDGDDDE